MHHFNIPHVSSKGNFFVLEKDALAEIAERDKTILEQQARIEEYEDIVNRLLQYNGGDVTYAYLDNNLSALEAHDREVRIKCLEDAANNISWEDTSVKYKLLHMIEELKEQS